ncbi:hypothetical protein AC579_2613 [Pseudocercospora musae]|uniref:Uncharacterized protein n=1 Tax=Pseudocercospora musae TaxID=113226 RepID=A0A139HV56_9PEZI|nr:hypothetical protein AC579_2613 [Pseudocercospora musae]
MLSSTDALQSIFVFFCALSDYLLTFDTWILSASLPLTSTNTWISTTTSCLAYAILEPLSYQFMTSLSDFPVWWFLMSSYIHMIIGVSGTTQVIIEEFKDRDEGFKDRGEKEGDVEHVGEKRVSTPELESASSSPPSSDGKKAHKASRVFRFIPILTITTAAAMNAGMLFHTRYLSSRDSETWKAKFKFGWIVIAGLCLFFFGMSKNTARTLGTLICPARSRERRENRSRTISVIRQISNLALIFVVKAAMRWVLGQDVLTMAERGGEGWKLKSSLVIEDVVGQARDGQPQAHFFDRLLFSMPPWLSPVCSVISICSSAYLIWRARGNKKARESGGD